MISTNVDPQIGMVVKYAGGLKPEHNERKAIVGFGIWYNGEPTVVFDKTDCWGQVVVCTVAFFKEGYYEID